MRCWRILAAVAIMITPSARAAALKEKAFACRSETDARMALDLATAKGKVVGLESFQAGKIASRDCLSLIKGLKVSVDQKRAPLMCVRLTGDLDCYWTPEAVVDLNPPEPEKTQWPRVGKSSTKF